jgi:hypothetical protein
MLESYTRTPILPPTGPPNLGNIGIVACNMLPFRYLR